MKSLKNIGRVLFLVGILAALGCVFATTVLAADAPAAAASSDGLARGLGYIGAALAVGIAGIGGGIAVGSGSSSAIGALTEDPKSFGKALIFVALGEGIALYGLIIAIMIVSNL